MEVSMIIPLTKSGVPYAKDIVKNLEDTDIKADVIGFFTKDLVLQGEKSRIDELLTMLDSIDA